MNRCHECNSQIGENDVFCPFCGSNLQPAASGAEDVSDTAATEPSMADVPMPDILADFGRTSDNVPPEATADYTLPDNSVFEMTPESEANTAEEEIPSFANEPTRPDTHAQAPGLYEERTVYKEGGISKPLGELEDTPAPKSMFDSVRIMEPKPQDDVVTRIQGSSEPIPEAPLPSVLAEATKADPKPYTEPNLGRVDTDGKRSAKLKPLSEGTILNGRYEIVRK